MVTSQTNSKARVGLLILVGGVLFTLVIYVVASRSFTFSDRFEVKAEYNQVAGLSAGANVQYQGVSVGAVSSVSLPIAPGAPIEVAMGISKNAQHLVRRSTQAQIKTEGVLGNMIVVLVNPPVPDDVPEPEPVADGGTIQGVDPFDLFEITDNALASVQRFEQAAASFFLIVDDVREGKGTLGKLVYDPALYNSIVATTDATRELLVHLGDDAEALVGLATEATEGVKSIFDKVEHGDGTVAQLLNDPQVYQDVLAISDTLLTIAQDVRFLIHDVENVANWGAIGAFRFAELMEAGKHNWLFKRYFEERGYASQAPFEVREEAIAESFRQLQARERALLEWEQRLQTLAAALDSTQAQSIPDR